MLIEDFYLILAGLLFALPFCAVPHCFIKSFGCAVFTSLICATLAFFICAWYQAGFYMILLIYVFPLIILGIIIVAIGSALAGILIRLANLTTYQRESRCAAYTLKLLLLIFTLMNFALGYSLYRYSVYHNDQRIENYWKNKPTCSEKIFVGCNGNSVQ